MSKDMVVFCGNANPKLGKKIVEYMDIPMGEMDAKRFSDGEYFTQLKKNVRGKDVFIIQPTCDSGNMTDSRFGTIDNNIMELLIMIDACKRASARRTTAVMPYYGYARQDRKTASKTPISARVIADILIAVGVKRVLSMDLHSGQIQGFYNIPVDHLHAMPVVLEDIKKRFKKGELIMVSPDAGGVERTRSHAKRLDAGLAIVDKRREKANESEAMHIIGQVKGKTAILLDDMVDTAGTLCGAADKLIKKGATEVHAYCSHPVLSGIAVNRIRKSKIKSVTVTNSIPLSREAKDLKKIRTVSVAQMFGKAIRRIHEEDSLEPLFV